MLLEIIEMLLGIPKLLEKELSKKIDFIQRNFFNENNLALSI